MSLSLEPYGAGDRAWLHGHWTRPEVRRYLWDDEVIAVERVDEAVEASMHTWIVHDGDERIGYCGLRRVPGADDVEVLYTVEPEHWGAGVATAAARAVLDYGFGELGLTRIVAGADAPNEASFSVMRKLGMQPTESPVPGALYHELNAEGR